MKDELFTQSEDENIDTADTANSNEQGEDSEDLKTEESAEEINPAELVQKLLAEAEDRHLRLLAEFDNYRKRTQKEKQQAFKDSEAETIKKLLPVLDNFERALATPCSDEVYVKGISMIHSSLQEVLVGCGLEKFGEVGEKFNPLMHNAVAHIDDENLGQDVISQVFQVGYKIGDKILRYAMVQSAN